ncbi:DUF393 domain-containing protein [Parvularcula flava]|uniref:DUF393 domain-containing protein n=1 Tax=Aquisalinus luteolus TaxID=1566827 RepID=A0A8J3EQW2_9PROT|nr:DUF393 domain-containing protein [Aquisalinus luteolus]NHK27444.1 DUF393 domain-containing protein [Aquisalinus luteolus]GGH95456.1 thiol-disulfide oxidoreductase [Aquisalinus luteolus]
MKSDPDITVFYDGACPLCVREIGLLRRLAQADAICFEDVSPPDAAPSCDISRSRLMARFHARLPDGSVVEGARAFTEAWSRVPWLVWLRPLGSNVASRWLLDRLYDGFLKMRPGLQWLAGKMQ